MPAKKKSEPPRKPADAHQRIAALEAELAALRAAQDRGAPASRTHTAGGAVVQGSVKLANGHFIGRDFIPLIKKLVIGGENAEHAQLALASYLHTLAASLAGLNLGKIDATPDQTRQEPLELPDIYVPLDTTFKLPEGVALGAAITASDPGELLLLAQHSRRGRRKKAEPEVKMRAATALEVLGAHERLTLLGPPGSGKSTFGAHVLLALAQAWQGKVKLAELLGPAWKARRLLPIRVVLRQFAERHAVDGQSAPSAGDLWAFIGQGLQQAGWGGAEQAMHAVQNIARRHGALVLLDGLDECGDEARRQRVLNAVQAFVQSAGPHSRFIVTARPYAYPAGPDAARGIYQLADLSDERIEQFIRQWYAALVKRGWQPKGANVDTKRDDLLGAYRRPDLLPMARSPLLLTLMATLHSNRGQLPNDRARLYAESVDLLLQRWNRDIGADTALLQTIGDPRLTLNAFEPHLDRLAFEVHEANEGREGVADIPELMLLQAFARQVGGSMDKARAVLDFVEQRAGLLISQGERKGLGQGVFTFPHRTFQEFLAARHLLTRENPASLCRKLAEKAPEHWREAFCLFARLAGAERGAHAADALLGSSEPVLPQAGSDTATRPWPRVHLAALMLSEIDAEHLRDGAAAEAATGRIKRWLLAGLPLHPADGGAEAKQRAAMGDLLAALGDPRFDTTRHHLPAGAPLLGFVRVPALPGMAMARYPVTVAQFASYLRAAGVEPKEPDALRDPANRPVRHVDWHEAQAYAEWLTKALRSAPTFADTEAACLVREQGWRVTLPADAEWETWARAGHEGWAYPWDEQFDPQRANTREAGIRDTSSVGCFAPNDYGLSDMSGNVWEWTADNDPEQAKYKLVRGGSYIGNSGVARCATRGWSPPDGRSNDLGFRVVLRSAPVL